MGLSAFLSNDMSKQKIILEQIDQLNNERRKTQENMIKIAKELSDPEQLLIAAASEEFHEGIVGIVAGRLAENHYKPSLIMGINTQKGIAT